MNQVRQTIVDDDLPAFSRWLEEEPYLLGEASSGIQIELVELATYNNRERFIVHLLDRAPAMLQHPIPPPSSALHECAMRGNYDAARFLIDRGIDTTILDYRWNAIAEGWARHAAKDEPMADFLAAAEREQRRK